MSNRMTALGIDLGGTHLRIGMVTADGSLINFHRERITAQLSGPEFIEKVAHWVEYHGLDGQFEAVGIAIAASVTNNGTMKPDFSALPTLVRFPIAKVLSEQLGKPCFLGNDANLALLGETQFGIARNKKNALLMTLGTGIGGGLLLDGKIYTGSHSSGSEIGLTLIGDPRANSYQAIEQCYSPGVIMSLLGDQGGLLFDRVHLHDPQAEQLSREMFSALGMLITNIHLLLDLEMVIISGGLVAAGNEVRDGIQAAFQACCPPAYQFGLQIELGALPQDTAGVYGAACLCFQHIDALPVLESGHSPLPH